VASNVPAHIDEAERLSHRYHLIRVIFTLCTMGAVTMVIGFAALIDPDNHHPLRYFGGCVVVGAVCAMAVAYLLRIGGKTTTSVEGAMLIGLFVTYANTIYGGLLDVDPWWQVCGYLVVILIAGGTSIRRWKTFWIFIAAGIGSWALAIETADQSSSFIFDSYVLILLGAVVAGAILWLFQIERRRVTELNRELQQNATHDPLTGVLNRGGLLNAALLTGESGSTAWCAYVDIDYFKLMNDRHGHDHGDAVLCAVARSLGGVGGELTARWGGDEFVVLGAGVPPSEESIQTSVEEEMGKIEPDSSVTVGVATGRVRDSAELASLMTKADRRMYERRAIARGEQPRSV